MTRRLCPLQVRSTISDFAVFITIMIMVLVDYLMGIPSPKLNVPDRFEVMADVAEPPGTTVCYVCAFASWKSCFTAAHIEAPRVAD